MLKHTFLIMMASIALYSQQANYPKSIQVLYFPFSIDTYGARTKADFDKSTAMPVSISNKKQIASIFKNLTVRPKGIIFQDGLVRCKLTTPEKSIYLDQAGNGVDTEGMHYLFNPETLQIILTRITKYKPAK